MKGLPVLSDVIHAALDRRLWVFLAGMTCLAPSMAQGFASTPYTPDALTRHHLQRLADEAGLPLLTTQWPLPADAVRKVLAAPVPAALESSRLHVLSDLDRHQQAYVQIHWHTRSETLPGYGDNYTPGSGVRLQSPEWRWGDQLAGRLGFKAERHPNSLQQAGPLDPSPDSAALLAEGSSLVANLHGWNLNMRAHPQWWGPGWQSSLVDGSNHPVWHSVGIQRSSIEPSAFPLLKWIGSWNFDFFVARIEDPRVVPQQPRHPLFSGMRLTFKPAPWIEVGLSRGLQTGGQGRPSGVSNFVKALLGQEVNKDISDAFVDGSGQIAGYDVRLVCPDHWQLTLKGSCSFYTQWMGEDAAGKLPLPYKFMSLWGVEHVWSEGRYRAHVEWTNTNGYSLPWDSKPSFPGYVNGVYQQGYTQGARWIGSAFGSGARVLTLGLLDAQSGLQIRLHAGRLQSTPGSYNPSVIQAPQGRLQALSVSHGVAVAGWQLSPEMSYMHLDQGQDQSGLKKHSLLFGLSAQKRWP